MLKRDLVVQLKQKFPKHFKKDLETVVDLIFDVMTLALREGRRIEIRKFGSFAIHAQKGRRFVNPKTGQSTICPSSQRIVFKAGKDLRSDVRAQEKIN
ncbi:MAG: integration host factor subunit beta [Nitrospiraceae bacterium]|nr:integration host factor subunit beta [Nitrospiraceae bacterium]